MQTSKPQNLPYWAILLPLVAVLIWSINIAVTRYVTEFIEPMSISFYRWFIAWLLLTPFMLLPVWQYRAQILSNLKKIMCLSAFGMLLYQGLAYSAAHYTSATNMGLINAFVPFFTIFVSFLVLQEKPTIFAILGGMLSFLGLSYVITQGSWQHFTQLSIQVGDLIMLLAVFCYAFYGVFLKKWPLGLPIMVSLYLQIFFAVLYHLPFLYVLGLDQLNTANLPSVLYAAIFPSLIAPLVWMLAVQYLSPNRTSIFMNLMPVFTAIIAVIWLKEPWTNVHTWGAMMILMGIILAQKVKRPN